MSDRKITMTLDEQNRIRSDKRKGDKSVLNKHWKTTAQFVKKKKNMEKIKEIEPEPRVIKERKKWVEAKPRKTKYSHLTAEEKKIAYRLSKEKRKELYARNLEKHREERKKTIIMQIKKRF